VFFTRRFEAELRYQPATHDKRDNVARGLRALDEAAARGAGLACFAELAFD